MNIPLNRNVVTQIRKPVVKLALTAKSCLMNLVPDWTTKFFEPPDPASRKRKFWDSDSSAAGGSGRTEAGTRRSKRLKLQKEKLGEEEEPKEEEEEEYSDNDNPSVVLKRVNIRSREELTEAVAMAWKRGAEILPTEELQRWVGLVKTELGVRMSKLRLEKEALQAIGTYQNAVSSFSLKQLV